MKSRTRESPKLACPFCRSPYSRVLGPKQPVRDTDGRYRPRDTRFRVYERRRECLNCRRRYPTIESIPPTFQSEK